VNRRRARGAVPALALVLGMCAAGVAAAPPAPPVLDVPLVDGRLDLADILWQARRKQGMAVPLFLRKRCWPIDARSRLGRAQLDTVAGMTGGSFRIEVDDERARVWLDPAPVPGKSIERRLERILGALANPSFGITFATNGDERLPAAIYLIRPPVPRRVIVLVHGLDDPGWMWRDMVPALRGAGHDVARMEYLNDGPIDEAADLLAWSLLALRAAGVEHVDVVAHSMGGLVTRDVLTRPAYYDGDGRGDERLPAIRRLIMCGTPNRRPRRR
jgi:hypothetical protein